MACDFMFKHNYLFIKIIEISFFRAVHWVIILLIISSSLLLLNDTSCFIPRFLHNVPWLQFLFYMYALNLHWVLCKTLNDLSNWFHCSICFLRLCSIKFAYPYLCVCASIFNCPCLEVKSEILRANALLPPCWFWEIDMRWSGLKGSLLTLWVISSALSV